MSSELATVVQALVDRVFALVTGDPEVKAHLRSLAQAFLNATQPTTDGVLAEKNLAAPAGEAAVEQAPKPGDRIEPPLVLAEPVVKPVEVPPVREPLPPLTLGQPRPAEPVRPVYPVQAPVGVDFGAIESRCRLKAEGARWAATRRRLMSEGANYHVDIAPGDRDIIARAKALPDCYLWMCHPSGPSPSDLALYEQVAGCFEAVAEGVALIRQIQDDQDLDQVLFEESLDLLAEAQSALRAAVLNIDGLPDSDQDQVFRWLKATASEKQIFIRRFMRLDDPADPNRWSDLLARIEMKAALAEESRRRRGQRKKLLGKVRHKATLILNNPGGAEEEWDLLIGVVCELVRGGLPPSNRELRESLIPIVELLPDREEVPTEFDRVLREIDAYLATVPPPATPAVVRPSLEVGEAARLLRGRSLVLIGGERRPGAFQALKDALDLKELIWIETRSHESFEGFGPYVARPDVAAVLLAIRWASHSYGEVKRFCDQYDKPLVRLPGGYNPNQVAAQIVKQASDRLR